METSSDNEHVQTLMLYPADMFGKYTDLRFTGYSVTADESHYRVNFKVMRGASECLVCYFEVNEPYDAFYMIYQSFVSESFKPVWKKDRFAQERFDRLGENG